MRTIATDLYPSSVIVARAGLHSADIIIIAGHAVRIFGAVVDTAGTPLADVKIALNYPIQRTRTDNSENYQLSLVAQLNRSYALLYNLTGYEEEQIVLPGNEPAGAEEKRIDVKLAALGDTTHVIGVVRGESGEGVSGASIQIDSTTLKTRYQGVSDLQGQFSISDVRVGADYRLAVDSGGRYERYSVRSLTISPDDPLIDISLKALALGRISWTMTDIYGNPVSNFTLLLINSAATRRSLPVTSDEVGYFDVDQVPEGELMFTTRANPYVQIRGIFLEPGSEVFLNLAVD